MSSLAQRMNEMLLRSAEAAGAENLEAVAAAISQSAMAQRSVVDDLLDAQMMPEEALLGHLSEWLHLPWEADLKPRNSRKLKDV